MRLRTTYKGFTEAVDLYFDHLMLRVVPLQVKEQTGPALRAPHRCRSPVRLSAHGASRGRHPPPRRPAWCRAAGRMLRSPAQCGRARGCGAGCWGTARPSHPAVQGPAPLERHPWDSPSPVKRGPSPYSLHWWRPKSIPRLPKGRCTVQVYHSKRMS